KVLQQQYRPEILDHRLRREIIATQVANQMVNLSGISFDNRMTEDTGAGVVDVMRAWVAARDIFNFPTTWEQIEALPTHVKLDTQLELFLEARRMVERGALWLLRHRRPPLEIATVVAEFRPGITELSTTLDSHLRGKVRDQLFANEAARLAAGIPESVAQRSVAWPLMHTSFDIIDLASRQYLTVRETAAAYWEVFDTLELGWLWDAVGMLPRNDRWQTQARSALRDDLMGALADLADDALYVGGATEWAAANERVVSRAMAMFAEIRRTDTYDLTTLSVALRQLRNLVLITQRPATA
ncbi:MAG TPA: hypothetical protein VNB52_05120, partial [Ilumatobacteraceae bacterium]|nr:hypothetical protein [Ilumatobacteraceae bacterium]